MRSMFDILLAEERAPLVRSVMDICARRGVSLSKQKINKQLKTYPDNGTDIGFIDNAGPDWYITRAAAESLGLPSRFSSRLFNPRGVASLGESYELDSFLKAKLVDQFCPEDPPPPSPAGEPSPSSAPETSGAAQRIALAAGAAILVGATAVPWYTKIFGWVSRAAAIVADSVLLGAELISGVVIINPFSISGPNRRQDWT